MSQSKLMSTRLIVFFCVCGWVYATSAKGGPPSDAEHISAAPGTAITVGGEMDVDAEQLFAADVPDEEDGDALPAGQNISVSEDRRVELHVEGQDVTKILKLLSLQSQRNIIAGRDVSATVSADLYNVDFYEALDAVLHVNGFGYVERGNFIYVYTAEEMAEMKEQQAKLVVKVVRLNYLSATYAANVAKPLMSERGSIVVNTELPSSMEPTTEDNGAHSFAYPDILVLRDRQEHIDEVVKVIEELDQRPLQLQIEATILQVELDEDNAFGTDLSLVLDNDFSIFGDPLNAVDRTLGGTVGTYGANGNSETLQTTVGNVKNGDAGIKIGVVTKNVSVFLRALDSVTDTTVIARPKLMVLNKQRAKLLAGAKLGYLSSTSTDVSTTQTVEFLEIGTQLSVRPFAGDDGWVRLEVEPSVSDGTTISVSGVIIPNETSNELMTNVMVRSGQTVVIGGLFKEDTSISRNQVPGAGSVPLVGGLLTGQDDEVSRSEVIFLITPTVLKDTVIELAGAAMADEVNSIGIGARKGLLPWSRGQRTAAHVRDAMKYRRHGNAELARYHVDMALSNEPGNPDALRLKRQLQTRSEYEPSGSVLQHMVEIIVAENRRAEEEAEQAQPEAAAPARAPQPAPEPQPKVAATPGPVAAAPRPTAPQVKATPVTVTAQPAPQAVETVDAPADAKAERPSVKLLEAMSRWLPDAMPTAVTAEVGDPEEQR